MIRFLYRNLAFSHKLFSKKCLDICIYILTKGIVPCQVTLFPKFKQLGKMIKIKETNGTKYKPS